MELVGSKLTEDMLEQAEQGQGAHLVGHAHIEGDADQLRQTTNDIENCHEMFMILFSKFMNISGQFSMLLLVCRS